MASVKPPPRNFVKDKFKAGDSPEEIFATITNGLAGTKMVGYPQLVPAVGECKRKLPLADGDYGFVRRLNLSLADAVREGALSSGAVQAVTRTTDSPERTITDPLACLAIFPDSMLTIRPLPRSTSTECNMFENVL